MEIKATKYNIDDEVWIPYNKRTVDNCPTCYQRTNETFKYIPLKVTIWQIDVDVTIKKEEINTFPVYQFAQEKVYLRSKHESLLFDTEEECIEYIKGNTPKDSHDY